MRGGRGHGGIVVACLGHGKAGYKEEFALSLKQGEGGGAQRSLLPHSLSLLRPRSKIYLNPYGMQFFSMQRQHTARQSQEPSPVEFLTCSNRFDRSARLVLCVQQARSSHTADHHFFRSGKSRGGYCSDQNAEIILFLRLAH